LRLSQTLFSFYIVQVVFIKLYEKYAEIKIIFVDFFIYFLN